MASEAHQPDRVCPSKKAAALVASIESLLDSISKRQIRTTPTPLTFAYFVDSKKSLEEATKAKKLLSELYLLCPRAQSSDAKKCPFLSKRACSGETV